MPLFGRANRIVNIASVTQATSPATIFATTRGKVNICFIQISGLDDIVDGGPVLVTFHKNGGTPVYLSSICPSTKAAAVVPGFILPAGGLEVSTNQNQAVTVDVFYETEG